MTKDELQNAVDALPWYHAINVGHGITTPGLFPINLDFYKLPESFAGKRVLDVGTYDGFFAFEAAKRGAKYVCAIDDFSDTIHEGEKRSWAQFDLCAEALGFSETCFRREYSVYDFGRDPTGPFDVVLFFGVLYHCRNPLLVLERLRLGCKPGAMLLVESHICDDYSPYGEGHGDKMVMEFYPGSQLAGCATNWWAPTLTCMASMIKAAGFERVSAWKIADPGEPTYCRGYAHAFVPY